MEIKDVKLSYKKIFKQTYVTALRQGFSDYKEGGSTMWTE